MALRPDPEHPISAGYACVKGTRFARRIQRHPDRQVRPRWQGSDVGWDDVYTEIGGRLRALLDAHGPRSVGIYSGNAAGHNLGAVLGVVALQRALGTPKHYSCLTLDNSEQFVVAEAVFGHPLTTFVADYAGSDLVVLLGTDPLSSQASQGQSHPSATEALRQRGRAGQLVVVDPRRSPTARAAGTHLQPRVGTDVFLLAWLLRGVLPSSALTQADRDGLAPALAPFTRDRVAQVTGLVASQLEDLATVLRAAQRPLVWSGLGILLGAHGTLGWWLTLTLQAALGGLDRVGGWRSQPSAIDVPRWFARLGVRGHDPRIRSPVGDWPAILGTLPAATLAGDILGPHSDRLRALIVVGGDPASALPHTAQARQALDALDLLVCVDLFENATGRFADALLPAATWLERDQLEVHLAHQRPRSHLRLDRAVVPPPGACRADWDILIGLCRAAGRRPFGSRAADLALRAGLGPIGVARGVTTLSGVRWADVASPQGHLAQVDATAPPGRFAVDRWCRALAALPDPAVQLRLITSVRPVGDMNHWIRGATSPVVCTHPTEIRAGPARLTGPGGSLDVTVAHDPDLPEGTAVLPFGDARANPNHVIGIAELEPFTGQPVSNGSPVRLEPG